MTENPPGDYHTVTPLAVVRDADAMIEFAAKVLDTSLKERHDRDDGAVMHAEIVIGDSVVMLSSADDENPPFPATLNVYVDDVDQAYQAPRPGSDVAAHARGPVL